MGLDFHGVPWTATLVSGYIAVGGSYIESRLVLLLFDDVILILMMSCFKRTGPLPGIVTVIRSRGRHLLG
jgi:hypothetical protein